MKTVTKILSITAVVGVLGGSAFALKAHAQGGHRFHRGPGLFAARLAELGVTDAQKEQIHAILRQHLPEVEPLVKQFVTERRALRGLVHADQPDEKAIHAQVSKAARIGADLAVARAHTAQEIKPVLTPEQVEKLKDMRDDADERIDLFLSRIAKRIAAD
jgi:Spy/CpxP family protein refolding chaperone